MIQLIGIFLTVMLQASTVLVPGGTVTFFLHDDDLNKSHRGIDEVSTLGLLEFKLAGTSISGPSKIVETGVNSGVFLGKVSIPTTINGRDITQGDVLVITYNDESDASGNSQTISKSIKAKKSTASLETSQKNIRIGQTFQVRIYDPDFNLDSRAADNISLSLIEFRGENGIRTTLRNSAFEAKTSALRETGDNTNQFIVTLKMPKEIDGKIVKIGSTAQLKFTDNTSPSGTTEKLKINIRIGLK
ncbi:MAG: hypothetical protein FJ354_01150 [Thaumarchaeota archaeon]|nr:hypothetical protein [Nitrososphaerota archaeon]